MKKNETKKLTLSKETLFPLNRPDLRKVLGGAGWSDDSVCPTTHGKSHGLDPQDTH